MLTVDPVLDRNVADIDGLRYAIRRYLTHPAVLLAFALAPVMKVLGYMPLEYPALGVTGDIVAYTLRMAIYIMIAIRFEPVVLQWAIRRNLPFLWTGLAFFTVFLVAQFLLLHGIFNPRGTPGLDLDRLALIFGFSVFLTAKLGFIVEREVRPLLGRDPNLVPFFWAVPRHKLTEVPAALIDDGLGGRIRSLQAQNQYVRVTSDQGSNLLRMSLTQAIAKLPPDSGCQVHRSWWVSHAELRDARFIPEDGILLAADGQSYPVGRTYQADVTRRLAPMRMAAE